MKAITVNYPHALDSTVMQFKKHLEINKRQAKSTSTSYVQNIRAFGDYLADYYDGDFTKWAQVNQKVADAYIAHCMENNKSPRGINLRITALRMFFDFLMLRQAAQENPFYSIRHLKPAATKPLALSDDDLNKLLCAPSCWHNDDTMPIYKTYAWDFRQYAILRDESIICLLAFAGLKTGEIREIRAGEFDLATSMLVVHGKTYPRTIYIDESISSSLIELIKLHSEIFPASDYLFLIYAGSVMTARSIERMIKEHTKRAGISPDLSPRLLRDAFQRRLVVAGVEDWLIQYLLGHEYVSTTQTLIKEIRFAIKKATPKIKECRGNRRVW